MDAFLDTLDKQELIAVDTEFQRETTYYPHLALVQIATESAVACIDPLAFDARPALQKLLLDTNIVKIFHSCSQDLEVLFYYLQDIPSPIYDTQIAYALLNEHHQAGYATVVEQELGEVLDKSQTRTNWLQRPLTDKQIKYAADDVTYLYQLHAILDEQLIDKDRVNWFQQECAALIPRENSFHVDTAKLWQRVKGASKLKMQQLALVQKISIWREQLAQQKDKIRRKILADDTIIQIAMQPPEDLASLNLLITNNYVLKEDLRLTLLELIQNNTDLNKDDYPTNTYIVLDAQQKQLLKTLQQQVTQKAEQLGIAAAMLCSRKDLEQLIIATSDEPLSKLTDPNNWRFDCIGRALLETLKNAK